MRVPWSVVVRVLMTLAQLLAGLPVQKGRLRNADSPEEATRRKVQKDESPV